MDILIKKGKEIFLLITLSILILACVYRTPSVNIPNEILRWEEFSHYIDSFNQDDNELYQQYVPNSQASEFLKNNIPYFDCPDKELEKIYYFRWWTYRKHIKKTPEGFVITEFLPKVPWSGKYNTINCPAGHHFYEGRWLHNQHYLVDYANFWCRDGGGNPRQYSFWMANSFLAFAKVHGNDKLLTKLLPDLDYNFEQWKKEHLCEDGLFWQTDNLDGMEVSIGGSGKRSTINSYMYGDAVAIAHIAQLANNELLVEKYTKQAKHLKQLIQDKLWDKNDHFFKTLPKENNQLVEVRELHGFVPWYFNIPKPNQSVAWKQLLMKDGFKAPLGPTSAEQRDINFKISYEGHECQWNGPSWPFATTQTLKAMSNFIRSYNQNILTKDDYYDQLKIYANSHYRTREDGKTVPWIDENINPYTGDWISRTRLKKWESNDWSKAKGGIERGKDYNHSGFCDLIISDLIGLSSSLSNQLIIDPCLPANKWDWFCLDHIRYHNHVICIVWDKDGSKYKIGKGMLIYVDGSLAAHSAEMKRLSIKLTNQNQS